MHNISIKLTYKASGLGFIDKNDLEILSNEIKNNYISNISPNGGPQAGGVVDAIIEILMDIPFLDFFKIIRDGVIFDVVSRGKDSFVLKPLFDAFKKIEANNVSWDYTKVKFLFNNTQVIIYGMTELFTSKIEPIFNAISQHYDKLENPYQIIIPISKSENEQENGDIFFENNCGGINFELNDYLKYWGIIYDYGYETKVYDVENSILIDKSW
jgi:hypothetical protein